MVTIYQTAPRSPKRGTVLCLVGLLTLCIAGGIWGFRNSRRRAGEENLEMYGIVVAPRPEVEPVIVIDESTFADVEPDQRAFYVEQAKLVQSYYNTSKYMGGLPARRGRTR